jgi:signal transduction histidine kinase
MLDRQPQEPESGAVLDRDESPSGRTAFVLRDVTDSRDLRPAREAFLAVLSHELRTPITTIYAGSSVLARRPGLSPSATRSLAADISAEAARLYDLVEDLLVLARLERRVLDPLDELVLVRRSVDSTIRMILDRRSDIAIERAGDADVPPVHGDATYVDQACRNLIMASIRQAGSEPGRQIVVEVRSDPDAGEVTVAVLDRGPALSDDELLHAFELPNGSAVGRVAGSGVGPFVARHLVESMGGRVWARNRAGGGLETGFALPVDGRA